jgi:2'-5' RNA ligase
MQDFSKDGMVALLPTTSDWCKGKLPHCTIVYLGDVSERSPAEFNDLGKLASSVSTVTPPLSVKVIETEVLGDEERVNTLRLEPSSQLKAVRHFFEMWDVSEFMFRPHCTIGPAYDAVPDFLPMHLTFDRIMVAWGDDALTFWLKGSY